MEEEYIEVPTEDDYYEDDEITFGDISLILFLAILGCGTFAFVARTVNKHLSKMNIEVGKFKLNVESKEQK